MPKYEFSDKSKFLEFSGWVDDELHWNERWPTHKNLVDESSTMQPSSFLPHSDERAHNAQPRAAFMSSIMECSRREKSNTESR